MSRKHRNRDAPFPLFAFQDIVTSVIGIMFLLVILLLLDLLSRAPADEPASAPVAAVPEPSSPKPESDEAALRRRVDERRSQLEELRARLRADDAVPSARPQNLDELRRAIERLSAQRTEAEAETAENEEQRQADEKELAKERQKLKELRRRLALRGDRNRITFLPEAGAEKTAILVERGPEGLRSLALDGKDRVMEWKGSDDVAAAGLLRWAGTLGKEHWFFLVLVGTATMEADMELINQRFVDSGFDVGYEPLPAGKTVVGGVVADGG